MNERRSPAHNMGLAKWRLTCFYNTFVVKQTAMHLINFSVKMPPLRQAMSVSCNEEDSLKV